MKIVYIASPYTVGDVAVNVKTQMDTADSLIEKGYCPIAPLLSHFLHINKPRPYEDWTKMDMALVRVSDYVLRLPGESRGADAEVELAKSLKIPVVYNIGSLK